MNRALATFALLLASLASAAETPPNILFAIADDWGAHASAYGTAWVKTPAFDRIATEGLLFKNAYTPVAKCAPSRAIVLTGRYAWQLGEAGNHMARFPPKFKSWPEVLVDKGWHMGITGKGWGPGIANDASGKPRQITGKPFSKRKSKPPTPDINNLDYAANFQDFLDTAKADKPWCFWFGSTEPHRSYDYQSGVRIAGKKLSDIDRVPPQWPDTEVVRHDILDYALEVEHTDTHLARMIAELENRGLLENTLIIVTSDHGMPFPRGKGYAYEDSNHIPLAIRWPGKIKNPGRIIDDFVSFTDIAATILDVAQISEKDSGMEPITGKSWREIWESEKSGQVIPSRDHALIGKERTDVGRPRDQGYPIRGIIKGGWLFLKNYEPSRWPAGNPETGYLDTDASPTKTLILERGRMDRSDKFWQLNFGLRPEEELYDLSSDTHCIHNLAVDSVHSERKLSMLTFMENKLKSQKDPRMFGKGQVFDNYVPTSNPGFYERFLKGDPTAKAGWINESDIETAPIDP